MRATTGRLSLSTTGRARMLFSVSVSKLILQLSRGARWREHTSGTTLRARRLAGFQRITALQLQSKCEFSGILHRYITMGLSAKVAVCGCSCS
jgi:hypothetical protein